MNKLFDKKLWEQINELILICPQCKEKKLVVNEESISCTECNSIYKIENGIPLLYSKDFESLVNSLSVEENEKLNQNEQILKANLDFHNSFADGYDEDPAIEHLLSKSGQSLIKECVEYCKKNSDGKIWIDTGCGTGMLLSIANHFPITVGLDLSKGMLVEAKEKGHDVFLSPADATPISDSSVDFVSASALLHHLPDVDSYFKEVNRILKPGGMFFSDFDPNNRPSHGSYIFKLIREIYRKITPTRESIHTVNKEIQKQSHMADYHMYYNFSFNGEYIKNIMEKYGFKNIRVEYYFNKDGIDSKDKPPIKLLIRRMLMAPIFKILSKKETALNFFILAKK